MHSTNGHGPKQAILYARVSTEEQVEKGYSIGGQLDEVKDYAETHGWEVVAVETDPGYSRTTLHRPGLDRVRKRVRAGGVDTVLAWQRDRFGVSPYPQLLAEEFVEYGTKLRALDDSGDGEDAEFMDGIKDLWAKQELRKFVKRSRMGKLRKAREGKILAGRAPTYGYRYNETNDGYLVDTETMPVVRRIFRMIGAEGASVRQVKHTLEREGVPTPGGGRYWDRPFFRDCVRNDCYRPHTFKEIQELVTEGVMKPEVAARLDPEKCYGIWWFNRYRYTRKTVVEVGSDGQCEYKKQQKSVPRPRKEWIAVPVPDAGVPRELVDAARDAIRTNHRPSSAGHRVWELSGGILRYGACGRSMTSTRHRRTPRSNYLNYYRCCGRRDKGKDACSQTKGVRAEVIEEMVWSLVSDLLKNPEQLRADLDALIAFERDIARDDPEHEAKAWLNKLAKMDCKRSGFQDMAAEGLITFDELRAKLTALEETRKTAQRELEALNRRREKIEELERDRDSLLDSLVAMAPDALDALAPEERLNTYKMLGLGVLMRPEGGIEASGTFVNDLAVCTSTPARA
jgi:site-specific DNA recombinase